MVIDAKKDLLFHSCRKLYLISFKYVGIISLCNFLKSYPDQYDIIIAWKNDRFPISNFVAVCCDSSLFRYWSYQDGTLLSQMTSIKIGAKVKEKTKVYLNENQQLYNEVMWNRKAIICLVFNIFMFLSISSFDVLFL